VLWKSVHVIASLATLAAVVIKLGLHWRWIVATARRYIFPQPPQPAPASSTNGIGRREFLRLMGGVSVFAAIAAGSAVEALKQTASTSAATTAASTQSNTTNKSSGTASAQSQGSSCSVQCNRRCSYPGHCRRYADSNNNGRCDLGECA
jgi:hypothetical protein